MDRISDFFEIRHRASGAFIEVYPVRPELRGSEHAFKIGTRVCVRRQSVKAAARLPEPTSMWRYYQGKFLSQGGAHDFLVLTAVFIEQRAPVDGGQGRYGNWELMLYNQEGIANLTAYQYWIIGADGTIRLKDQEDICLVVTSKSHDDDDAFLLSTAPYQEAKYERLTWHVGHYALPSVCLQDRFVGSLLGLITGDSLGSPLEGWTAQEIAIMHPHGVHSLTDRRDLPSIDTNDISKAATAGAARIHRAGHFTCRTSFALALATSLAERRRVDALHIRQRNAEFFAVRALAGAARLFTASDAADLEDLVADRPNRPLWPPLTRPPRAAGGQDGAATCARAAALALAFTSSAPGDEVGSALIDGVREALSESDSDLHGAYMVAKAVQLLMRTAGPADFDPAAFLADLAAAMDAVAARPALLSAQGPAAGGREAMGAPPAPAWCAATPRTLAALLPEPAAAGRLGAAGLAELEARHGLRHSACVPFPGRAADSVPAALWAFALHWRTPRRCLARAVAAGGDCATAGAVAGALLGALHGPGWVDGDWFRQLENGVHGRDYAVRVAGMLVEAFPPPPPARGGEGSGEACQ